MDSGCTCTYNHDSYETYREKKFGQFTAVHCIWSLLSYATGYTKTDSQRFPHSTYFIPGKQKIMHKQHILRSIPVFYQWELIRTRYP